MKALVTGATGFIGRHLLRRLEKPVVLGRNPDAARGALGPGVEIHAWDPLAAPPPLEALRGVEAVFHLAGEPVAEGRWNAEKKRRIIESRQLGTAHLVEAIEKLDERPRVLVSASAVGYYGSRGDAPLDESADPGADFLAEVCKVWELEAQRAARLGVRAVQARIGIVLGRGGGALAAMLPIFRRGLGGRLTLAGRQWMPWVHVDDVVGLLLHAAGKPEIQGPVNVVSPNPVTNAEFTRTLAAVLGKPAIFHAPALMLRLALGEFATALLASQRVLPRVAEKTGYAFRYTRLEDALRAST
jgi:hypothetical protein